MDAPEHGYTWSGAFRAERARCEAGKVPCTELMKLAADAPSPDAFDTLMEVLRAKMATRRKVLT